MSEQQTQFKTEFNIKIDQPTLKQVFEGLRSLVDTCTLCIDPEGISCITMDNEHVILIHVALPNSIFEKYEIVKQGFITLKIDDMLKIINDIPKDSTVNILNDDKDLILLANNTTYYLEISEQFEHYDIPPLPRIPYDSSVTLEPEVFTKYLTRLNKFGEHFSMECTSNTFTLASKTKQKKFVCIIKLEKGMEQLLDINCKCGSSICLYSIERILPYLKTIPKNTPQIIGFSERKPLRNRVKVNNIGYIDLYLAPRIEDK